MRFLLKQRFWCMGDDFIIRDGDGNDRFLVDGRAFSLGDKLSSQDMQGHELAIIRQRLPAWAAEPIIGDGFPVSFPLQ